MDICNVEYVQECYTGFPKKDARFSKLKNIPDLLSDEKDGKIMENIDFSYFSNRASFMGNPVCKYILYLTYLGIPGQPKTYPCSIDQGSPLLFPKNFNVCEEPLLYQIPDSFQVAILPYQRVLFAPLYSIIR